MAAEQIKTERQSAEIEEQKFRDFIAEIAGFHAEEEAGAAKTSHFLFDKNGQKTFFNPEALRPEDMAIWEKVKDGSLEREDFQAYEKAVVSGNVDISRRMFCAFIANKAMGIFGKRELLEYKKKKNKTP
jgi:hypothetical protein